MHFFAVIILLAGEEIRNANPRNINGNYKFSIFTCVEVLLLIKGNGWEKYHYLQEQISLFPYR